MEELSKVMTVGAVVLATLAGVAPRTGMSDGIQRHDTGPDEYDLLLNSSPAFEAVGKLAMDSVMLGSAVLIGRDYAISTKHQWASNDTLIEALGVHVALGDSVYGVMSVDAHGRLDAALLRLDRPVTHVEPVRRSTTHPFLLMGREAVFVGFGARGTAFDLDLAAPGIKGAGSNRIDMVSLEPDGAHRLWWDFDHPEDATLNKLGSSEPLPTEYMPIGGDSGGGVFVADSLGYALVALVGSGGSYPFPHQQPRVHGYYGSFGYEVSITSVSRWLDSLIAGR